MQLTQSRARQSLPLPDHLRSAWRPEQAAALVPAQQASRVPPMPCREQARHRRQPPKQPRQWRRCRASWPVLDAQPACGKPQRPAGCHRPHRRWLQARRLPPARRRFRPAAPHPRRQEARPGVRAASGCSAGPPGRSSALPRHSSALPRHRVSRFRMAPDLPAAAGAVHLPGPGRHGRPVSPRQQPQPLASPLPDRQRAAPAPQGVAAECAVAGRPPARHPLA